MLRFGPYSVYVHAEGSDRHHLPHCHVRWPGGGSVPVSLVKLRALEGSVAKAALDEVRRHRDVIVREWNRLNPYRPIEENP